MALDLKHVPSSAVVSPAIKHPWSVGEPHSLQSTSCHCDSDTGEPMNLATKCFVASPPRLAKVRTLCDRRSPTSYGAKARQALLTFIRTSTEHPVGGILTRFALVWIWQPRWPLRYPLCFLHRRLLQESRRSVCTVPPTWRCGRRRRIARLLGALHLAHLFSRLHSRTVSPRHSNCTFDFMFGCKRNSPCRNNCLAAGFCTASFMAAGGRVRSSGRRRETKCIMSCKG